MTGTVHKLPLPNWPASDDLGNVPLTVMVSEETAEAYRKMAAECSADTGKRVSERFVAAVVLTDIAKKAAK